MLRMRTYTRFFANARDIQLKHRPPFAQRVKGGCVFGINVVPKRACESDWLKKD